MGPSFQVLPATSFIQQKEAEEMGQRRTVSAQKRRPLQAGIATTAKRRRLQTAQTEAERSNRNVQAPRSPSSALESAELQPATHSNPTREAPRSHSSALESTDLQPAAYSNPTTKAPRSNSPALESTEVQPSLLSTLVSSTACTPVPAGGGTLSAEDVLQIKKIVQDSVSSHGNRMTKYIVAMHRKLAAELASCNSALSDLVKLNANTASSLENIKHLIIQTSAGSSRIPSRSRIRGGVRQTTSTKNLEKEVLKESPTVIIEINAAVNADIVSRSLAQTLSSFMDVYHNNQDDTRMTSRVISVLLFGLKHNQSRSEFKQGLGKKHASFRFSAARRAVMNARMLSDESIQTYAAEFTTSKAFIDTGADRNGVDFPVCTKPSWLQPGVLDKQTLHNARMHHECVKAELPPDPSCPTKRKHLFICKRIVTIINDCLRISRDRSKVKMFESGLFLLVNWSEYVSLHRFHSSPTFRFLHSDAESVPASEIPDTTVGWDTHTSTANQKLLAGLIAENRDLVVQATYQVSVTGGTNHGNRVTEMKRNINMLRMALRFICAYCHCGEEMALGSHLSMLRTIYRIARFFKQLLLAWANENSSGTTRPYSEATAGSGDVTSERKMERMRPDTDEVQNNIQSVITEIRLRDMLPGRSEKEKVIGAVLKISKETFARLNISAPQSIESSESAVPNNTNESRRETEDLEDDFSSGDDVMEGMLD